jgi:hypothetical protein
MKHTNFFSKTLVQGIAVFIFFIMVIGFNSCENCPEPPPLDKGNLLTESEATAISKNYIELLNRIKSQNLLGLEGNEEFAAYVNSLTIGNSSWVGIEEMESYIAYIKTLEGPKGEKATGIRFYNGIYPKDMKRAPGNHSTIFFAPVTKRDGDVRFFAPPPPGDIPGGAYNYLGSGNPPAGYPN